ncbi:hypothetical protein ACLOJK_021197 [Asimina triloba]
MASQEDTVKKVQLVEARARNISHNVRCTDCGSQSIEDSQADVAILLRKVLAITFLAEQIFAFFQFIGRSCLLCYGWVQCGMLIRDEIKAGAAVGVWAYQKHRRRTNVHIMALNLVRGVPLTPKEKQTMLELLTPPPPPPKK